MKSNRIVLLGLTLVLYFGACGDDESGADTAPDSSVDATPADSATPDSSEPADSAPDTAPDIADTTAPDTSTEVIDTSVDNDVAWTPNVYSYPTCGTATASLAGCVEPARLASTLTAIVGSRFPGEPKWQATQDLCKSTFESLGYTTTLQPTLLGANVIGVKTGTELPNEQVILGAHYDGVRDCDAADDNGSGVAGLLEAARILAPGPHKRTLVVVCWDVEELGLIGSKTHAASVAVDDVVAVYDLETIGFTDEAVGSQKFPLGFELFFPDAKKALDAIGGRGVFITLIAGEDMGGPTAALTVAATAIGLPTVPVILKLGDIGLSGLADLGRSDHASFWARGIPAVQLTDSANFRNPNYHCLTNGNSDTIATLDMAFTRAVVAATIVATKTTLDAVDPGTSPVARTHECDVVSQDCGPGKRCSFVQGADSYKRQCIDLTADPASGSAVCERPQGISGKDTCDVGLFCAFYGGVRGNADLAHPTFERVCSPLCLASEDCAAGATCVGVGYSLFEPTGICLPPCDVFADLCGEGQKCALASLIEGAVYTTACEPSGPLAADAVCTGDIECGAGYGCASAVPGATPQCRPYCDATHECEAGTRCASFTNADPTSLFGVCLPD